MTDASDRFMQIINSSTNDLKQLAYLTGVDIYSLFQGFDFRGLNLSGQDLTGMNFDGADFSMCNLSKVRFDIGAFNNAIVPKKFAVFKDVYDITFSDLSNVYAEKMHAFYAFRPLTFSQIRLGARLPFSVIAREVGLSSRTLRNADEGMPVAHSTATRLARYFTHTKIVFLNDQYKFLPQSTKQFIMNFLDPAHYENQKLLFAKAMLSAENVDHLPMPRVSVQQPVAVSLELIPSGGFELINRRTFNSYLDYIRVNWERYRDMDGLLSPNTIRWRLHLEELGLD